MYMYIHQIPSNHSLTERKLYYRVCPPSTTFSKSQIKQKPYHYGIWLLWFLQLSCLFPFPLGLVFRAFESRSAFSHKSTWQQVVELIPQMCKTAYLARTQTIDNIGRVYYQCLKLTVFTVSWTFMLGASGRQWRTSTAKWWGWLINEPRKVICLFTERLWEL